MGINLYLLTGLLCILAVVLLCCYCKPSRQVATDYMDQFWEDLETDRQTHRVYRLEILLKEKGVKYLKLAKSGPMACPTCGETLEGKAQDYVTTGSEGWEEGTGDVCMHCDAAFYAYCDNGNVIVEEV